MLAIYLYTSTEPYDLISEFYTKRENKEIGIIIGSRFQEILLEDQQFVTELKNKIEKLTGDFIDLRVNEENPSDISVQLDGPIPVVNMGSHIYEYSGFARMCVEYSVASIKNKRPIDVLEFHIMLGRN